MLLVPGMLRPDNVAQQDNQWAISINIYFLSQQRYINTLLMSITHTDNLSTLHNAGTDFIQLNLHNKFCVCNANF